MPIQLSDQRAVAKGVDVPRSLVPALRATMLYLCGCAAEQLAWTLEAYLDGMGPAGEVAAARHRLEEVGHALDQTGSEHRPAHRAKKGGPPLRLAATSDVLMDATLGSLTEAGEALAIVCRADEDGSVDGDPRLLRDDVRQLYELLGTVRSIRQAEELHG